MGIRGLQFIDYSSIIVCVLHAIISSMKAEMGSILFTPYPQHTALSLAQGRHSVMDIKGRTRV